MIMMMIIIMIMMMTTTTLMHIYLRYIIIFTFYAGHYEKLYPMVLDQHFLYQTDMSL